MEGTVVIKNISPSNDGQVELQGAADTSDTTTFYNAATVTCKIKDLAGSTVVTTQTLSYVAASDGNYLGTLDKALWSSMSVGSPYLVEVTAAESGADGFWRVPIKYDNRIGDKEYRST